MKENRKKKGLGENIVIVVVALKNDVKLTPHIYCEKIALTSKSKPQTISPFLL